MIKKKLCMAGLFGVGKTSLVRRFVESIFSDRYLTTVGVKIDRKDVVVDGRTVSLAIWDIAGEDDQAQFRLSNVRGASGLILVADGCRRASLDTAVDLHRRIEAAIGSVPFVLVVNKCDLRDEWEIQPEAIEALAAGGWRTIEASAKTGQAVEQVFEMLARDMIARDESAQAGEEE